MFLAVLNLLLHQTLSAPTQQKCLIPESLESVPFILSGELESVHTVGKHGYELTVRVNCRYKYSRPVPEKIVIQYFALMKGCSTPTDTEKSYLFYLNEKQKLDEFNMHIITDKHTMIPMEVISERVARDLRHYSYSLGLQPTGDSCPADCYSDTRWASWSDCSSRCGSGTMIRHLVHSTLELSAKCEPISEVAHCNVRHCQPSLEENTEVNSYMMVGKCQTASPVTHTLCKNTCRPSKWEVKPVRVLCDGVVKFKALQVISECDCQTVERSFLEDFNMGRR